MQRLWILVLLTLVGLGLACSELTTTASGGPGAPAGQTPLTNPFLAFQPSTQPLDPGRYRLRVVMLFGFTVPSEAQNQFRANRDTIEGPSTVEAESLPTELTVPLTRSLVEADGQMAVVYSPQPATTLSVQLGGRTFLPNANGEFELEVLAGDPPTADLVAPDGSRLLTLNLVPLNRSGYLTAAGTPGEDLPVVQTFDPCFMNEEEFCGAPADGLAREVDSFGAVAFFGRQRRYTTGPLGTYPLGNSTACLDKDGAFGVRPGGVPGAGLKGDDLPTRLVTYLWSTCDYAVLQGICPFEGGRDLSSVFLLLRSFYAALEAPDVVRKVDDLARTYGYEPQDSAGRIHCYQNHRGRVCDEIVRDDLAISLAPQVINLNGGPRELTHRVQRGETVQFTVHFNGGKPYSRVTRLDQAIGGELRCADSPDLTEKGGDLLFYNPTLMAAWDGKLLSTGKFPPPDDNIAKNRRDQTLTYTAPAAIDPARTLRDTFQFRGDAGTLTVHFEAAPPGTPQNTSFTVQIVHDESGMLVNDRLDVHLEALVNYTVSLDSNFNPTVTAAVQSVSGFRRLSPPGGVPPTTAPLEGPVGPSTGNVVFQVNSATLSAGFQGRINFEAVNLPPNVVFDFLGRANFPLRREGGNLVMGAAGTPESARPFFISSIFNPTVTETWTVLGGQEVTFTPAR